MSDMCMWTRTSKCESWYDWKMSAHRRASVIGDIAMQTARMNVQKSGRQHEQVRSVMWQTQYRKDECEKVRAGFSVRIMCECPQ